MRREARLLISVCTHPGGSGSVCPAVVLLIRVRTHPGFQVWAPRPLIGVGTNWASGVGAQAADRGMHPSRGFGPVCPGSWAADLGVHSSWALVLCEGAAGLLIRVHAHPGFQAWAPRLLIGVGTNWFQVCAGLLIRCSQSRG